MAVIDKDLFSPLGVFLLVIFGIESIVSLLGNGFVLAVCGHSWLRSKKMLPSDFLLTTLSLSRFLLQWTSMSSQFVLLSSPEKYVYSEEEQAFSFTWDYLNAASLWCATWLNVFYCVKVTSFNHPLFSWLKLRIGVLVPRLLGISLLTFIICSIPSFMRYSEDEKCHDFTGNLSENTSKREAYGTKCVMFLNTLQISSTAISVSVCLTASLVLLLSLWRHTRNLKKGGLSTKDFSTQAHLRVMKPLLLSLFFFILHFAAMILALTDVFKYGMLERLICEIFLFLYGKLERLICEIFLSSYPSAHSIILIFTNPRLRKAWIHILKLRRSAS
ncbi:UNVERIFIED_CONTAM: hypothetical protein K2H54_022921 [Gekko kuhli]